MRKRCELWTIMEFQFKQIYGLLSMAGNRRVFGVSKSLNLLEMQSKVLSGGFFVNWNFNLEKLMIESRLATVN